MRNFIIILGLSLIQNIFCSVTGVLLTNQIYYQNLFEKQGWYDLNDFDSIVSAILWLFSFHLLAYLPLVILNLYVLLVYLKRSKLSKRFIQFAETTSLAVLSAYLIGCLIWLLINISIGFPERIPEAGSGRFLKLYLAVLKPYGPNLILRLIFGNVVFLSALSLLWSYVSKFLQPLKTNIDSQ